MNIEYRNRTSRILFLFAFSFIWISCTTRGENDTIYVCGYILGKSGKKPIVGAEVALATCKRGAVPNSSEFGRTDSKGYFQVEAPPCSDRGFSLFISAAGYRDTTTQGTDDGGLFFESCSTNEIIMEEQ